MGFFRSNAFRRAQPRACLRTATRVFALVLTIAIVPLHSADEKRIVIYGPGTTFSLPVTDRDGREYVGLLECLEPLGTVSARVDGTHWKLRYNDGESDFTANKNRARVRGRDMDFPGNFLLENNRGLVPLVSLGTLLPRILNTPVSFNPVSRRLFVGNVATHFTAQLSKTTPPRLVMNFTAPVNPTIATEPGRLRMSFTREPLVAPGTPTLTFDDKSIPSATYVENNGVAEVTVNGNAPLMASFSNDGRTITVAPVPQQPAAPAAAPGDHAKLTCRCGTRQRSEGRSGERDTLLCRHRSEPWRGRSRRRPQRFARGKRRHACPGAPPASGIRVARHSHAGAPRFRRQRSA